MAEIGMHVVGGKRNVVYVGRIPHGFYENEMKEIFEQFGTITKLRISLNKQRGKSKHYGFIQFKLAEVAAVVAESTFSSNHAPSEIGANGGAASQNVCHDFYLEHPILLKWVGANNTLKVLKFQDMQRKIHNKVRTPAERKRQVMHGLVMKDEGQATACQAVGRRH